MHTKTLPEMTAPELMSKVETLFAHLERMVGEDNAADWAIASIQGELRRRLCAPESPLPETSPITVKVHQFVLTSGSEVHPPLSRTVFQFALRRGGDASAETRPYTNEEVWIFQDALTALKKLGCPIVNT